MLGHGPFGEVKVGVIGAAVGKGKILKGCNDNQRIGPLQKAGNLGGQCGGRGGRSNNNLYHFMEDESQPNKGLAQDVL